MVLLTGKSLIIAAICCNISPVQLLNVITETFKGFFYVNQCSQSSRNFII